MKDERTTPRKSRMLTVLQAAEELNVSRSTLYALMDAGQLTFTRIGRSRRVPAEAVEELIRRNTVSARA